MANVAVILHVEACHLLLVRAFANHAGHSIQSVSPKSRHTDHDFKCLVCRPADREDFCFCCNSPATQDIILCGANSINGCQNFVHQIVLSQRTYSVQMRPMLISFI